MIADIFLVIVTVLISFGIGAGITLILLYHDREYVAEQKLNRTLTIHKNCIEYTLPASQSKNREIYEFIAKHNIPTIVNKSENDYKCVIRYGTVAGICHYIAALNKEFGKFDVYTDSLRVEGEEALNYGTSERT